MNNMQCLAIFLEENHYFNGYITNVIELPWLKVLHTSCIDTSRGMSFEHVNLNDLLF